MYSNLVQGVLRKFPTLARPKGTSGAVVSSEASDWPGDLTDEMASLAEAATLVSGPTPPDPRICEHALPVTLNPEVVPDWLREATVGRTVSLPEVPGLPQAFRVDGYVDWRRVLDAHGAHFEVLEVETPTTRCLEIVESLRRGGHDADIVAQVYVLRRAGDGCLVFGLEAAAIALLGTSDPAALVSYMDELDTLARAAHAGRTGMLPELHPEAPPSIEFC